MPQRGLCTVLEEEEETAISEKRHVFAELHNAPTYFFSHLKTKNNFFKYKSKNIYIAWASEDKYNEQVLLKV